MVICSRAPNPAVLGLHVGFGYETAQCTRGQFLSKVSRRGFIIHFERSRLHHKPKDVWFILSSVAINDNT